MLTIQEFLSCVDHTLLKPEATRDQILNLCTEAKDVGCFAVCVNGAWVPTAVKALSDSKVQVCAVVGFPLGAMAPSVKAFEARLAVEEGADEIDMVINIGHLKSREHQLIVNDVASVRAAIGSKKVLKVILETAVLTDDEICAGCLAAKQGGCNFVKTSTGFHPAGGASEHAVQLMKQTVGDSLGIKASGGIRTLVTAESMIRMGATRLGLSATLKIIEEIRSR